MRSSAASGCKCTADTAHWVMDAAAGSCFFVKRKRDNARGPEGGWLLKTSRWLLIQTTIYGDGTQPSRSTIPISLDRKPENNKQNTQKHCDLPVLQENTAYLQHVFSQSIQHWDYQAALRRPFQIPKSKQEEGSFANRCPDLLE